MQMEQLDKTNTTAFLFIRSVCACVNCSSSFGYTDFEYGTSDSHTVRRILPSVDAKDLQEHMLIKLKFSKGLTNSIRIVILLASGMVQVPSFACKCLFANSSQFTRFDVYLLVIA